MPKILDVLLASLSEDSNPLDNSFNQATVFSISSSDQFTARSLTPTEFAKEYDEEFSSYFPHVMDKKTSSNTFFLKIRVTNRKEIDSILTEHSYSKKQK